MRGFAISVPAGRDGIIRQGDQPHGTKKKKDLGVAVLGFASTSVTCVERDGICGRGSR